MLGYREYVDLEGDVGAFCTVARMLFARQFCIWQRQQIEFASEPSALLRPVLRSRLPAKAAGLAKQPSALRRILPTSAAGGMVSGLRQGSFEVQVGPNRKSNMPAGPMSHAVPAWTVTTTP